MKSGAQGHKGPLKAVFSKKLRIRLEVEGGVLGAVLGVSELMSICHCSKSTAYRWISGDALIPKAEMELIHIKALGLIPHSKWNGFRVDKDGVLFTPNDYRFTPESLIDFQRVHELNQTYRRDLKMLTETKIIADRSPELLVSNL